MQPAKSVIAEDPLMKDHKKDFEKTRLLDLLKCHKLFLGQYPPYRDQTTTSVGPRVRYCRQTFVTIAKRPAVEVYHLG